MLLFYLKLKPRVLFSFILSIYFLTEIQAGPDIINNHEILDQDQDHSEEKLVLDSTLSVFKHRKIDLDLEVDNVLPLDFSNLPQGMFVTHFQSNGKLIGHLTTDHNRVYFIEQVDQPYDFSLKSPIKTNLLTIQTQHEFIFQKAVEAQVALLTCKSVEFRNKFKTKENLTVQADSCNNHSQISCLNFKFDGNCFYRPIQLRSATL